LKIGVAKLMSNMHESNRFFGAGYLAIPADLVNVKVAMPLGKLDYSLPRNPSQTQLEVVHVIAHAIDQAKHPIILVDGDVRRTGMINDVTEFVKMTSFPTYAAPMGIDAINHELPNYRGCYQGSFTIAGIRAEFKQADLILKIGSLPYDTNTGGFTTHELDPAKTIAFQTTKTQVFDRCFEKIAMQELIPLVTRQLFETPTMQKSFALGPPIRRATPTTPGSTLSQSYFWATFPSFLSAGSMVIAETGTVSLGSFNLTPLPKDGLLISQVAWGSVGYAVPATFGACLADRSRRCFLLVGDGAFQFSAQELSSMLRQGICPIIILFNNNGFLIEKLIHPNGAAYNDIPAWKYSDSLTYFGGTHIGEQCTVRTPQAYQQAMHRALAQPDRIHFIDAVFPSDDIVQDVANFAAAYGRDTA
jgi:pyruvate decarboxylase